jgi:hypothetical protein
VGWEEELCCDGKMAVARKGTTFLVLMWPVHHVAGKNDKAEKEEQGVDKHDQPVKNV